MINKLATIETVIDCLKSQKEGLRLELGIEEDFTVCYKMNDYQIDMFEERVEKWLEFQHMLFERKKVALTNVFYGDDGMKMERFNSDTKRKAVELSYTKGYSLEQAAKESGCSLASLYNWRRQAKDWTSPERIGATASDIPLTIPKEPIATDAESGKIKELKAEIQYLKMFNKKLIKFLEFMTD